MKRHNRIGVMIYAVIAVAMGMCAVTEPAISQESGFLTIVSGLACFASLLAVWMWSGEL